MSPPGAAELLRELFQLYRQGGVEAALPLLADDVVVVVTPAMSAEPDVYEGHDGARRYFAGFDGAIDEVRFDLRAIEDALPDTALAVMAVSGVGAATRIPIAIDAVVLCTARDGRIARMAAHPNLEAARVDRDERPPQLS
jgi:ketosteroid isomerase-like protein